MRLRSPLALLLAGIVLAACSGGDVVNNFEAAVAGEAGPIDLGAIDRGAVTDPGRIDTPLRPRERGLGPDQAPGQVFDGKPGEFVLAAAGRTYRLLVPSGYTSAKAIALLTGFHGAGDSGANFYAICKAVGFAAAAAPASFILLVPETKSPNHDFAIWSGNPMNDLPQMKQEMDEIVAIIKDVSTHYRVDARRVHAFGFSDGGLFTAVAGMYRADFFGSLAVCGYGWGSSYPMVTPARKIATQLVCGQNDSFFSLAQKSEAFLKSSGHPTRLLAAAGVGHSFIGLMQAHPPATLFSWMEQNPLP